MGGESQKAFITKLCDIKVPKDTRYLFLPKNSGFKSNYGNLLISRAISELDLSYIEDLKILERRGEDIPYLVDSLFKYRDIISIGITGDDLLDEYIFGNRESSLELINTTDWVDDTAMFGRPVLALIGRDNNLCLDEEINRVRNYNGVIGVPSKYYNTSLRYLNSIYNELFELDKIVCLNGSIEESIDIGLYDYAIDVVYSGGTLRELDLKVIDIVRASDISTIVPKNSFDIFKTKI
jgi:ATP phosphoribosyltransferase